MKKFLFGLAITAALLAMVAGTVLAQETTPPLSGEVQSVTIETDTTSGTTTVVVTLVDELDEVHTVRIGLQTADDLGLVEVEQSYVVVDIPEGTVVVVSLESDEIMEEITEEETEDESLHPVGFALSEFLSTFLGVDYDTVMAYHEDGIGFGVIAQAVWMTKSLEGDTAMLQVILDAKKSGDFSAIVLDDGSSPTNWGQFRQAVLKDKGKAKDNLGTIKSGKEVDDSTTETDLESVKPEKGNKDKDKDKGKDKGKDD